MSERRPNTLARVAAIVVLLTVFMLVGLTILNSGDSGGGDDRGDGILTTTEPTAKGERALDKGYYVVKEGDTLAQIAENTGLELDQLEQLNPTLDPQALSPGQKVRLR